MKKVQDIAAYLFIVCVIILAIVSVLGVWDFFAEDVISKSFQTIGLLAVVAVIIIIAGRVIDSKHQETVPLGTETSGAPMNSTDVSPSSGFTVLRHITLVTLIISVSLLALIGVLAIWEVLSGDVMNKSLASIGIIAFTSFIIVVTCMERENHKLLRHNGQMSWGRIVISVVFLLWVMSWFMGMFR